MKTNKLNAKHWFNVGPGGWYCNCCGPAPKHRKLTARIHKRKMYRMFDKQIEKENDETA